MKKSTLIFLISLIVILFIFIACQKTGNIVKKTAESKKMAALNLPSEQKQTVTFGTYDASCASKYCCTMGGDRNCLKCCEGGVQKNTDNNNKKEEKNTNVVKRISGFLAKFFRK